MVYISRLWHLLRHALPQRCLLTQQPLNAADRPYRLSSQGRALLQRNQPACIQCAHPFPFTSSTESAWRCGHCLKHAPPYDMTIAAFTYATPLDRLVHEFKFQYQLDLAKMFSQFLFDAITTAYTQQKRELPKLILPVPIYKSRFYQRGFNQAFEIAKPLSKQLAIPLNNTGLQRIKNTPMQSGLRYKERQQNLRHAFQITKPIRAKHVAIIDDVMTTGATAHAISNTLKRGGVEQVDVWIVARTPNYYNLLR